MIRYAILRATYEASWAIVVAMFVLGWALAFTDVGAVLIVAATGGCVALLVVRRTPEALIVFAVMMSLGWFPLFFTAPWLLMAPVALLAVAWRWRRRRRVAAA